MSAYDTLQSLSLSQISELAELFGDLYSARSAMEKAQHDAELQSSADWLAEHHGAQADAMALQLAGELEDAFPQLREPLAVVDGQVAA